MTSDEMLTMIDNLSWRARMVNQRIFELRLGPDTLPIMREMMHHHCTVAAANKAVAGAYGNFNGVPIAPMRIPGVAIVTARVIPVFKITKATPIPPDSQP